MATIEAQSLQLFAVNSTASEENSTQGPQLRAEQQYEQQGGVDGGSIMVHMIHMVHIMVHILSRWGKHYGTQHILSRGCKQVELRRVWQQFCKYAILTITIIPRGFSMICIISVENKLG